MEYKKKYANMIERQAKVVEAESQGLMMLYDNFDKDWKHGDEPHGTLVFTDVIPESPVIIKPRNLEAEIDALSVRISELETNRG